MAGQIQTGTRGDGKYKFVIPLDRPVPGDQKDTVQESLCGESSGMNSRLRPVSFDSSAGGSGGATVTVEFAGSLRESQVRQGLTRVTTRLNELGHLWSRSPNPSPLVAAE